MTWVKDQNERYVNIDNWDFIDYTTITDKNNDETVACKIYLEKNNEIYVLGYTDNTNPFDVYKIIEMITKNMYFDLETLESFLYYYLNKELDEIFNDEIKNKSFDEIYDMKYKVINELIGLRFVED